LIDYAYYHYWYDWYITQYLCHISYFHFIFIDWHWLWLVIDSTLPRHIIDISLAIAITTPLLNISHIDIVTVIYD
jgi:hypothetical protein